LPGKPFEPARKGMTAVHGCGKKGIVKLFFGV
jgi:hypothetical protein